MSSKNLFRKIRTLTGLFTLFTAGCLAGIVLFTPWEIAWEKGLNVLNNRFNSLQLNWSTIEEASLNSVSLRGFEVIHTKGKVQSKSIKMHLGLNPLVKIHLDTGETCTLEIGLDKTVKLNGSLQLKSFLPKRNISGIISLDGTLHWKEWNSPPRDGTITLKSPKMIIPPEMRLSSIELQAALHKETLELPKLKIAEPVDFRGSGSINLDWTNLLKSQYQLQGNANLGQEKKKISWEGKLRELAKEMGPLLSG